VLLFGIILQQNGANFQKEIKLWLFLLSEGDFFFLWHLELLM